MKMIDLSVIQQINQEQQEQDKVVKPVEIKDKENLFKASDRTGEIINQRRALLASDAHIAKGEGLNKSGSFDIKTPVLDSIGAFFEVDKEEKKEEKKEEPKSSNPWGNAWAGSSTTTQKVAEPTVDEKFDKYFQNRYKDSANKIKAQLSEEVTREKDEWNIFDLQENLSVGEKRILAISDEEAYEMHRKLNSKADIVKSFMSAGKALMKSIEQFSLSDEIEKQKQIEKEKAEKAEREAATRYNRYL